VADNIDTTTASGRLVLNVMASVSQWEREAIGERTADALAHMRANGQRVSRFPPYGFRQNGDDRWEEDPNEQQAVRLILQLRDQGMSLRKIGAQLEVRGFLNRNGRRLGASVIRGVIRRAG
jgi:DNA invertase Pin-like site-specific DNA recombinase